jgi:hypothetical protein
VAELSLAEIESLIGGALPPSAYERSYWASSTVARHNWNHVGFWAKLYRRPERVVFTRQGS